MIYKQFQDKQLSMLGFGTMRLPLLADGVTIDEQQVAEMTAYAMEHGVNYFVPAKVTEDTLPNFSWSTST